VTDVRDCSPFENAVDIRQKSKSFRANLKAESAKKALLHGFEEMKKIKGIKDQELENLGFAPVWIPDSQAPHCMACSTRFSLTNRRHHCRSCGDCICKACFRFRTAIPGLGEGEQSVCARCYTRITGKETTSPDTLPPPLV
jgi:PHP family Zn ribbon phosphoesterase